MSVSRVYRIGVVVGLLLAAAAAGRGSVRAQEVEPGLRDAYFRAIAHHFQVSPEEVTILGEWGLHPDEIPVVLFISEGAGVAPDALVGLRRGRRPWREIAQQSGMGSQKFHIALPPDAPLGALGRAYGEFRGRPPREWDGIVLEDDEIVYLVNLRFLSEYAGVPPLRVLRAREEAGSFVAGLGSLIGREGSG